MDRKCALFCASSIDQNKRYLDRIHLLIDQLSKEYSIVYGGANTGYMKAVAERVKYNNGYLIGVMPTFLERKELRFNACDEWIETSNMNTRKEKIIEISDCFIALPGGVGTYEEMIDVLSWMHIGLVNKPLVLYNVDNFYEGILKQVIRGIDDGFVQPSILDSFLVSDDVTEIITFLSQGQDDLWDIYDVSRQPIAKVIKKGNKHQLIDNQEYHLVGSVIIKNKKGECLLQKEKNGWNLIKENVLAFEKSSEAISRFLKGKFDVIITNDQLRLKYQITKRQMHLDVFEITLETELMDIDLNQFNWFNLEKARNESSLNEIEQSWLYPEAFIAGL